MTNVAKVLWMMLIGASLSGAAAQTLSFGVSVNSDLLFEPEVQLTALDFDDGKVGLRLAGGISGPLELGVTARTTQSFGPIGNIIFHGQGDVNTDGAFQVALGAEGVIASIAASVRTSLFTVEPGAFDMSEAYQADARPFLLQEGRADFGLGVALSARYRVSRSFIVSGYPEFYLTDSGGAGLRVRGEGRLVKLNGPDDLHLLGLGYLNPAGGDFAALGAEYALNRRSWPNASAALWLGYGPDGILPGGSVRLEQPLRSIDARYRLVVAAEPYRTDILPYRAGVEFDKGLGKGTLKAALYGTLDNDEDVPPVMFDLGYTFSF